MLSEKHRYMLIGGGVLAVILLISGVYFFMQYHHLQASPQQQAKANSQKVIQEVSRLYQLPSGQPTVAQIKDISKLAGQSFFKDAQNGDYVLIYTSEKIAIIYRGSTNQIVNVGPVQVNNT
ncbi:MAG TPA: hypothetical protein VGS28_01275 [Candidatus Saccharimonadales bacterium]|nr:hypothetical protein [Candidatus Saccharimonadales bacterium]